MSGTVVGSRAPDATACQVVNFKRYGSIAALNQAFGERWRYIGRANRSAGLSRSPLANPFPVGVNGRDVAIQQYRRWLWARIRAGDEAVLETLREIDEGTVLVCWCAPLPCHGEVVRAAAAWLRRQVVR